MRANIKRIKRAYDLIRSWSYIVTIISASSYLRCALDDIVDISGLLMNRNSNNYVCMLKR